MSTATAAPMTLDISGIPPVPFSRLVKVEMRKMADTRAGKWLLIGIAAITVVVIAIYFFAVKDKSFTNFAGGTVTPSGLILPVLGILLVTSEWGQRTTLNTFALTPQRPRLLAAKVAAATIVGLVAVALALIVSAAATALGGAAHPWSGASLGFVLGFAVFMVLMVVSGVAFGLMFLNSPSAIVLYLLLPQVLNIVFQLVRSIRDAGPWVNLQTAVGPLVEGNSLTGEEWGQLGTSVVLWLILPFAVGLWRVLRSEIK